MRSYIPKAIIGREIIGTCVKHSIKSGDGAKENILDRPLRVILYHKSNKRTGKWPEAYVNKEVMKAVEGERLYTTQTPFEIKQKLKDKYNEAFDVQFSGVIKGNQLIGECSDVGRPTLVTNHAACHRGQSIPMICKQFALCYINLLTEPTYTKHL